MKQFNPLQESGFFNNNLMIKLIFIRHPETDWNKQKRYMGSTDIPLNNKGKKQARAISGYFKNENISVIYSSKLKRALETAKLIARPHNLKVKEDKRLNEINFGEWEGLTFEQIQKKYPVLAREYLSKPQNIKIPGGESFKEFKNSIKASLGEILAQEDGDVVIVSHGGVNRVIICELLKIPFSHLWQIKQDGGAINKIEIYEDTNVVSLLNHVLWEN